MRRLFKRVQASGKSRNVYQPDPGKDATIQQPSGTSKTGTGIGGTTSGNAYDIPQNKIPVTTSMTTKGNAKIDSSGNPYVLQTTPISTADKAKKADLERAKEK